MKVLSYADQPPLQLADTIHIGIVVKAGRAESSRFGLELKAALDKVGTVAGRPHDQVLVTWAGPSDLVEQSAKRRLLVLYLAPGLDAEVREIAHALEGVQLITMAASDSYVPNGCILGFALVSGHPKMVFNLGQAKKQDVTFRAAVMRLMRIVE